MKVEYVLTVRATCPVDASPDIYTCTVRSQLTIPVEKILEEAKRLSEKPVYQEDFTQALHRALSCEVETVGWHSGVKATVVCGEPT